MGFRLPTHRVCYRRGTDILSLVSSSSLCRQLNHLPILRPDRQFIEPVVLERDETPQFAPAHHSEHLDVCILQCCLQLASDTMSHSNLLRPACTICVCFLEHTVTLEDVTSDCSGAVPNTICISTEVSRRSRHIGRHVPSFVLICDLTNGNFPRHV